MVKPFASKAQMERIKQMVADGQLTQAHFDERLAATPDVERLPERLHPKKESKETALFGDEKKDTDKP